MNTFVEYQARAILNRLISILDSYDKKNKTCGKLLTAKQTMELLGIKRTTLWKYTKEGYLKPIKVGKRKLYLYDDIVKNQAGKQ